MAGSSNIQGDESIIFADNASFDGTERGGKMTTNGQVWMGAAASPHVRLGDFTSSDSSLTISYLEPTATTARLDLKVTGGAPVHGTGTDNHIVRWDGTGVPVIQDGVAIETDTGEIQAGNGAVGTPAFTFVSDTDTGIYSVSANVLGVAAGGSLSLRVANTNTRFPDGVVATPSMAFINESGLGIYRQGSGNFSAASGGNEIWRTTAATFTVQQVLGLNGGWFIDVNRAAGDVVANSNQILISITDTTAARTVTLPSAPNNGQIYIIKDSSGAAGTNNISVTVNGGVKTIDGLTTQTISSNYGCMWVYYDSTAGAYFII